MTRIPYYNRTNTCDNIKENGNRCENRLEPRNALREYDENDKWTGRWLCRTCYYALRLGIDIRLPNFKYNDTNTCDNIKEDGVKCDNKLKRGNALREYDENDKWTGRWLCRKCWKMTDYDKRPDTYVNIVKSLADRRTGNIKVGSANTKGDMFEELTCRWRGVKNLNVENDNYKSPIDHSRDPELGIIQTKGRLYDSMYGNWSFDAYRDHNKEFDNLICYCADKDGKYIERIYIFPKEEVIKRTRINICKNPSRGTQWYEKYRVKDEDTLKMVNDIWRNIIDSKKIKGDALNNGNRYK